MKIDRKKTLPSDYIIPCSECQAGHMRRILVVYYTWLGDDLITVPDFPAWVCDVCGRREYDLNALNQLSLILSPNAGKATNRQRRLNRNAPQKPKSSRASHAE
ncbi:MAG: YgiT-type zinc finger protein [Chloroflexota bacterium]|jgi:YgiT-type zinc finger domain-containing protein